MSLKEMKSSGLIISGHGTMHCGRGCASDFVISKKGFVECASCGLEYGKLQPTKDTKVVGCSNRDFTKQLKRKHS